MAGNTGISWAEAVWNPTVGCTVISPGCTNYYIMEMASGLPRKGIARYAGTTRPSGKRHVWTGKLAVAETVMEQPLGWKKPRRIFVNSMSDLFHDRLPDETIARMWQVMKAAPQHAYLILTKRPERMLTFMRSGKVPVLPQVWLGVSIENQDYVGRIDMLRPGPGGRMLHSVSVSSARSDEPSVKLRKRPT